MLTKVLAALTIAASLSIAGAAYLGAFSTNATNPVSEEVNPTATQTTSPQTKSEGSCPACQKKAVSSCCED